MKTTASFLLWAMLLLPSMADDKDEDRAWERVRAALEKKGIKVDHFARTAAERQRELESIAWQLEKANDPTSGKSLQHVGGGNGVLSKPAESPPELGKPSQKTKSKKYQLSIGKLGDRK